MTRRRFFKSAAGMAAAFVAMNETYGPLYVVSRAEAQTPDMANERAKALKNQFIMDMHTHFLRDDTPIKAFVAQRATVGKLGLESGLGEQGADHRRPEVPELLQGSLPRQRHQGRLHQRLVLGRGEVTRSSPTT